jgi:hypothetical protein
MGAQLVEPEQKSRGFRLGIAAVGPGSVAVAHFGQSLLLLRYLPAYDFGAFAFLLTLAALSWSVWSALFCAPLPFLVRNGPPAGEHEREGIIASSSFYAGVMISPAFALVAALLGLPLKAVLLFTCFATLSLFRWFGRASAYLHGRELSVFASDLTYSTVLVAGLAIGWWGGVVSLTVSYAAMSAAALLALLPFGLPFAGTLVSGFGKRPLRSFRALARTRLGWSMLSVVCTEITDHSHAYLITLFTGAQGYAPVAATGQLVRPMSVVSSALRDMERPRFARMRAEGKLSEMYRSMRTMRIALVLAWLATAGVILALFLIGPNLLFPRTYTLEVLIVGAVLWVLISGLSMVRVPEGSLLQAAGVFRELAIAQLYGAAASLISVILLLLVAGPVWSLAGTLVGQTINAIQVQAISRRWRRENDVRKQLFSGADSH